MRMLAAAIGSESLSGVCADCVVRKHTLNSDLHCSFRFLNHHFGILVFLKVSDPTGVPSVSLLVDLVTGENCLFAVDDDYVIATINVGCVGGLVFAVKNGSSSCSKNGLRRSFKKLGSSKT